MDKMKFCLRYMFKGILIFISFIIIWGLLSYLTSLIIVNDEINDGNNSNKKIEVYLLSNGVHTDIVVPKKNELYDWSKEIQVKETIAKDSTLNYLAIGWGDKGFYLETPTWSDLKVSTALKAVSGFNSTAMHVTFYKKIKEASDCKKILISSEDYIKMISLIKENFKINNGSFQKINTTAVYGKNDVFYEANGHYTLFYTCNTWVNQVLKKSNQRAALWTISDTGILRHY